MPFLSGIAAMAVLSNTFDQAGVDPQVDRQYAIVKQNEVPVAQTTGNTNNTAPAIIDGQATGSPASFTSARNSCEQRTISYSLEVQGAATTQGGPVTVTGQGIATTSASAPATAAAPGQAVAGVAVAPGQYTITTGQAVPAMTRSYTVYGGLQNLKGMDRKVSVKFTNATAADVLKWLSKQNVNFVANVDRLPKSKITMNVSNVPLHEALETVAASLGGSWQVKGSTLIFQNGGFFGSAFAPAQNFNFDYKTMPKINLKGFDRTAPFMKWDDKAFKDMKGLQEFKVDPKMFGDMKTLDGKAFQFKWDDKDMAKMKLLNDKDLFKGRALSEKQLKDMKVLTDKMVKDFALKEKDFAQLKGLKGFDAKDKALFEKLSKNSFGFKKVDAKKFLGSLSAAQKELMKKQGHLKVSDLTEEQRGMIFENSKAELPKDFTFILSLDGEKVTIKN